MNSQKFGLTLSPQQTCMVYSKQRKRIVPFFYT